MTNKKVYLSANQLEGTSLKPGYFIFGADGKMEVKNGPDADGYFYVNGVKQSGYKLFAYEGNYYYVGDYNKYVTDKKVYLSASQVAGTSLVVGYYNFDETGKLIIK